MSPLDPLICDVNLRVIAVWATSWMSPWRSITFSQNPSPIWISACMTWSRRIFSRTGITRTCSLTKPGKEHYSGVFTDELSELKRFSFQKKKCRLVFLFFFSTFWPIRLQVSWQARKTDIADNMRRFLEICYFVKFQHCNRMCVCVFLMRIINLI